MSISPKKSREVRVALMLLLTLISTEGFARVRFGSLLSPVLSSINFGSVPLNSSTTKSETLTNRGWSTITISQVSTTGAFSVSGLTLPLNLAAGQSVTFAVKFTPISSGPLTGNLAVLSNRPTLNVPLSGAGSAAGSLTLTPSSLNFGSLTLGTSATKTVSLTANSSLVVLTSATTTDPEFTLSGVSFPLTIAAGQSTSVTVNFKPQSSGVAAGTISLVSNASNSPAVETVSGTGTALVQHTVNLNWTSNTTSTSVAGYNIYRGASAGGPYSKLNSSTNVSTSFTDNSVQSGVTYFYVTTAVASDGIESSNSNEARATIPTP